MPARTSTAFMKRTIAIVPAAEPSATPDGRCKNTYAWVAMIRAPMTMELRRSRFGPLMRARLEWRS